MFRLLLRDGTQEFIKPFAEKLLAGEEITLNLNGDSFSIEPGEIEVKVLRESAEGYATAEDRGYMAALDIQITEELENEGLAREVVRRIQNMRKSADFDLNDRIEVVYTASDKLKKAITDNADYIRAETLANSLMEGEPNKDFYREEFSEDDASGQNNSIRGESLSMGVKQVL